MQNDTVKYLYLFTFDEDHNGLPTYVDLEGNAYVDTDSKHAYRKHIVSKYPPKEIYGGNPFVRLADNIIPVFVDQLVDEANDLLAWVNSPIRYKIFYDRLYMIKHWDTPKEELMMLSHQSGIRGIETLLLTHFVKDWKDNVKNKDELTTFLVDNITLEVELCSDRENIPEGKSLFSTKMDDDTLQVSVRWFLCKLRPFKS